MLATLAGDENDALQHLTDHITKINKNLHFKFLYKMPSNLIPAIDKHELQINYEEHFLNKINSDFKKVISLIDDMRDKGCNSDVDFHVNLIKMEIEEEQFYERNKKIWNQLRGKYELIIDNERCIHCMKCAGACPVGNIYEDDFSGDLQFKTKCQLCMRCLSVCTNEAIFVQGEDMSEKIIYRNKMFNEMMKYILTNNQ